MKTTSFHVRSIVFTRYKTYVKTARRKKYTQVDTSEFIKKLHFSDLDKNFFKKYKAENSCKGLFTHEKMKIEFQNFCDASDYAVYRRNFRTRKRRENIYTCVNRLHKIF